MATFLHSDIFNRILTNMPLTLKSLSKLLRIPIKTIGEFDYLPLNDKYVITEHYFNKELEINNLENYQWQTLSSEGLTDILNYRSHHLLE
ncbi:hypothetical protein [Olivibacter sp. XZL3]|uniref:hypothetical protein n=1 Tax=Olivibacter sp. XZL3 TaxID=1735116 RepID=UPI001F111E27|nr:hypothetical protein [Olivibacter sp. XZL3]